MLVWKRMSYVKWRKFTLGLSISPSYLHSVKPKKEGKEQRAPEMCETIQFWLRKAAMGETTNSALPGHTETYDWVLADGKGNSAGVSHAIQSRSELVLLLHVVSSSFVLQLGWNNETGKQRDWGSSDPWATASPSRGAWPVRDWDRVRNKPSWIKPLRSESVFVTTA